MNLEGLDQAEIQTFDNLSVTFNDADDIFKSEDGTKGTNFGE